jgi:hypothetical protein
MRRIAPVSIAIILVAIIASSIVWKEAETEASRRQTIGGSMTGMEALAAVSPRLALSYESMADERGPLSGVIEKKRKMLTWCRDWLGL